VIVFKYPVDPSQNFIKRLVGLPGETIDVRAGDIFIDGKIARKPDEMQSDCWKLVNDSRYVEKDPGGGADGRPRAWRGEGGLMKQTAGKTGYELKALGNKPAWIVYNRPIEDENRYNEGSQGSGRNTVGDVRVAFDATIGPKAIVLARLQCDDDIFEAEVAEARALLRRGGTKVGEAEIHFEARKPHRVVLARADARVTLEVDRERLFAYEFDPDGTDAKKSEVRIGVRGEGGMAEATFERIGVSRDVYYLSRIVNSKVDFPYRIGPGQYFAMGDNSANSTDSRAWETVPEGHLTGRAFLVFWPALPGDFAVRRIH
jgi:signal peptidase I